MKLTIIIALLLVWTPAFITIIAAVRELLTNKKP